MGYLVVGASAEQNQPPASQATTRFVKGIVYIQAEGSGTGTWSATFNVAPVSPGGVVGSVKRFTVSSDAPVVDQDLQTGASAFIGWWTGFTGSVAYAIGSVDG